MCRSNRVAGAGPRKGVGVQVPLPTQPLAHTCGASTRSSSSEQVERRSPRVGKRAWSSLRERHRCSTSIGPLRSVEERRSDDSAWDGANSKDFGLDLGTRNGVLAKEMT